MSTLKNRYTKEEALEPPQKLANYEDIFICNMQDLLSRPVGGGDNIFARNSKPICDMSDSEILYHLKSRCMIFIREKNGKLDFYKADNDRHDVAGDSGFTNLLKRLRPDFYQKYGVLFP